MRRWSIENPRRQGEALGGENGIKKRDTEKKYE
jgi:hypothetical protein